MTDAATITVDPKDYRVNARLLRRIWKLTKPYWSDKRHWKSWVLMAFALLMGPALGYYNFRVAQITVEQADALVARSEALWKWWFWLAFMLALGQWVYQRVLALLNSLMYVHLYRWMTNWMVERYLKNQTYYDITMKADIDNPDERIQTNVEPFTEMVVSFPTRVMGTILGIVTNGILLTQVTSAMAVFVFLYSGLGLVLQLLISWPLIRKNFDLVAASADFRFGLLRVRENAETIAFFRGEDMEEKQVQSRVDRVASRKKSIIYYELWTDFISRAFEDLWTLAPLVLIYPLYFKGQIAFGTIAMGTQAALQVRQSILQFREYISTLTRVAPGAVRLSQIVERFEELEYHLENKETQIAIERGHRIELRNVCFQTPGGEQQLAQNVSLSVEPGESLIIIGQTGVGKSSILRTMACLWTRGRGNMVMPPAGDMMFVPQKPYMMLGDLRAQLLYPYGRADMGEQELQEILERVCLPDLIEKAGGLDAQKDWSRVFSLGEQQRISFARILISRPRFVFLDESTSAVDIPTEACLYKTLIESGITFVSVGHRETILRFHERALRLHAGGSWDMLRADSIEISAPEALGAARTKGNGHAEKLLGVTLAG